MLADLSRSATRAVNLEDLARPLLEMLHTATGLESTYLTTIDLARSEQHVKYAMNTGLMQIPEGLTVPWADTLCKRALEDGISFCNDVAERWGDSGAAKALGIKTYASAQVRTSDGVLVGTLCAAGGESIELSDWAQGTLNLFSKMVSQHIERELLLEKLKTANATLRVYALADPLTGLPNRRAIVDTLGRMLARCEREGSAVLVGMVDLDKFKMINDTHGHDMGDRFLQEFGRRLTAIVRSTDLVGRLGGDEFAILSPCANDAVALDEAAVILRNRIIGASAGRYSLGSTELDYAGASAGVVVVHAGVDAEAALRLADAAMYADKHNRQESRRSAHEGFV